MKASLWRVHLICKGLTKDLLIKKENSSEENKSIWMMIFDIVEVRCHRVAILDEQPLIFVSIEIVEMDLLQVEFDLLIRNNNSVLHSSFDTKQRR
jgi:hypothetical protein